MLAIIDELDRHISQLLIEEPFYGHILSCVQRRVSADVSTAAVAVINADIHLIINEAFFINELKNSSERIAVIKHETLHLVLKHLFRADKSRHNHKLYNIAADLVVNQYIGQWTLPEGAVTLSTFPHFNLLPEKDLEYYYNILQSELEYLNQNSGIGMNSFSDSDKKQSEQRNSSDKNFNYSQKMLDRLMNDEMITNHDKWFEELTNLSDVEKNIAETKLEKHIIDSYNRTSAKMYGSFPAELKRILDGYANNKKAEFNWKRKLRMFACSSRKTRINNTIKRVSKRYKTRPGIKVVRFNKLVVAIDTSGSLDSEAFLLFFKEINDIYKQGTEITIVECDAKVQSVYKYKGVLPSALKGGGGTEFDPVFEFIRSDRKNKYDGCIFFTDGFASKPKINPLCPVLWVLTPNGTEDAFSFGSVLKIKEW